jgi:hypothetical protein
MKRVKSISIVVCLLIGLFLVSSAHAGLTTIGLAQYGGQNYNLIWDNDSPFGSIVWLDYTKSYANWQNQVDWAAGLNGGGVLTYNIDPGYSVTWSSDWRLPTTVDGPWSYSYDGTTAGGYNNTNSEMGHLWYTELGNKAYVATDGTEPQAGWGLTNTGDFQNLQPTSYWSGTEYALGTTSAWNFGINTGGQRPNGKVDNPNGGSALAVRPGDVTIVPEPISSTLFVIGACVLVGRRYLSKKK